MTIAVGLRLRQALPLLIEQHHVDTAERRAAFQPLGEDIQAVMVTVRREANVAEREERRGIAVVVVPRLVHHGDIDARLLQRFDAAQRQHQFFAGVARRVKIKTPGIDQIRHLQQRIGLPVGERTAVLPLANE